MRNQGIKSRNLVHPSIKTGSGSHRVREPGVAQIGGSYGDHVTNKGDGTGWRPGSIYGGNSDGPVKFGNEVALNVGKGGPGTGRDPTMRSGSQGVHGPVAGNRAPQGRDILSSYGPESSRDRG